MLDPLPSTLPSFSLYPLRLACQAMRQLHPEAIAAIQSKALFSKAEEQLLSKVGSVRLRSREGQGGDLTTGRTTDVGRPHCLETCPAGLVYWQGPLWMGSLGRAKIGSLSLLPAPGGDRGWG